MKLFKDYVCSKCGMSGVKLWRGYMTFNIELLCTSCVEKKEKRKWDRMSHSFGWRVAAVPTEENDGFWGYCAVPKKGVLWWESLPIKNRVSIMEKLRGLHKRK